MFCLHFSYFKMILHSYRAQSNWIYQITFPLLTVTPFHYEKENGTWFRCLFQLLNTYWEPITCQVWYYMSEHKAIISLHFMSLLYGKTTILEFWKSIPLEDQMRLVRKWTERGNSDLARGSSFIQFGVYQVSLLYTWAQKSSRVQKVIL